MLRRFLFVLFILGVLPLKAKAGVECAICGLVVHMVKEVALYEESSLEESMQEICALFPDQLKSSCKGFVRAFGGHIADLLKKNLKPDRICQNLRVCPMECVLFPESKALLPPNVALPKELENLLADSDEQLTWTPWDWIVAEFQRFTKQHLPPKSMDRDGDLFSKSVETIRGTNWRGRDCDDRDPTIHPGSTAASTHSSSVDHNCNGIAGVDPRTGIPYEDLFCGPETKTRGLIVIGDSVAAHFHIPVRYLNVTQLLAKGSLGFKDLIYNVENEMDWPQIGWGTGFQTTSTEGPVDSLYLRMRQRNRCVHRNYVNIGVNGASADQIVRYVKDGLPPSATRGPSIVYFGLIGNDICVDELSQMTPVDKFRQAILDVLAHLDVVLPAGSTVVLEPVVDGRVLWNNLHDLLHPIGGGVTYADLYEYLTCLGMNPCVTWMNYNETIRDLASAHAARLNAELSTIAKEKKFAHFNVLLPDIGIDRLVEEYGTGEIDAASLIDAVDGFHPSQLGNAFVAAGYWERTLAADPDIFGPVNPHNAEIEALFGDQGGH